MKIFLVPLLVSIAFTGFLIRQSGAEISGVGYSGYGGNHIENRFASAAVDAKNCLIIRSGGKIVSRFNLPITGEFHGLVTELSHRIPVNLALQKQ